MPERSEVSNYCNKSGFLAQFTEIIKKSFWLFSSSETLGASGARNLFAKRARFLFLPGDSHLASSVSVIPRRQITPHIHYEAAAQLVSHRSASMVCRMLKENVMELDMQINLPAAAEFFAYALRALSLFVFFPSTSRLQALHNFINCLLCLTSDRKCLLPSKREAACCYPRQPPALSLHSGSEIVFRSNAHSTWRFFPLTSAGITSVDEKNTKLISNVI